MIPQYQAFLDRYFILFTEELFLQLLPDQSVHQPQERQPEYHDRLTLPQAPTEWRHVVIAHPARIVKLVQWQYLLLALTTSRIRRAHLALGEYCGRLEFPHVQAVQEQLARLKHVLQLQVARLAVLTKQEVDHSFRDRRLLERRLAQVRLHCGEAVSCGRWVSTVNGEVIKLKKNIKGKYSINKKHLD